MTATAQTWDLRYQSLLDFITEHGRMPPYGHPLATWAKNQRSRAVGKTALDHPLTSRQIGLLEAVPGWTWPESSDVSWRRQLAHYLAAGKTDPRAEYWANRQRLLHRAGQLSTDRAALLESTPDWSWEPREDRALSEWDTHFAEVRLHADQHGGPPPLRDASGQQTRLGKWCHRQRQNYRGKAPRSAPLTAAQIAALESLPGWEWNPNEAAWMRWFERVQAHVEAEGSLADMPFDLANWCRGNRKAHRGTNRARMTPDRAARLESLPGWEWSPGMGRRPGSE